MTAALESLERQLASTEPPLSQGQIQSLVEEARVQLAQSIETQVSLLSDQWRIENPGKTPTYADLVAIQQSAAMIAEDLMSAQINERTVELAVDEVSVSLDPADDPVPAVLRWTRDETIRPTVEHDKLTEKLWPHRTPQFQVWAATVLAARDLDGLPFPTSSSDQLAREIEAAVDAHLQTVRALTD